MITTRLVPLNDSPTPLTVLGSPPLEVVPGAPAPTLVLTTLVSGFIGERGLTGPSAYETALANGFVGTEAEWLESLSAGTADWGTLLNKPATFPPDAHGHDYEATGSAAAAVSAHDADATAHPSILLALADKAAATHGHAIADVATLQAALDGKAAATHNHDGAYAALSHGAHVPAPGTNGHVLTLASGAPVWAAPSGGGGGGADPEGWTLIETIKWDTPLAAVDIALPWGTYDEIRLVGAFKSQGAANVFMTGLFSLDGGSTFHGQNYNHQYTNYRSGAAVQTVSSTWTTQMHLFGGQAAPASAGNPTHQIDLCMRNVHRPSAAEPYKNTVMVRGDSAIYYNPSTGHVSRQVGVWGFFADPLSTHFRLSGSAALVDLGHLRVLGRTL